MKVSIVIPNYNGIRFLKSCLDTLYGQTFKSFEVIIVDNASTDGSCEMITSNYTEIKLIKLDKNYGFSKAVNEGIKESKGEYVVLLNNDTVSENDWLDNLVKCIEKDENIFSCCSKMIQYNSRNKIDDAGDEYTALGWAYKRGDNQNIQKYNKDQEVFSSCAGAAIYRKSIFDEIGYFDERFFAYMEDVDISYRARIAGFRNMYCSTALIYHIGSATSGSKYNSFKVKLAAKNNLYVPLKNMPFLQLLINIPFLVLGFLIKSLFFYKKGFGKEYVSGLKEGLSNFAAISKSKDYKVEFKFIYLFNYIKIEIYIIVNTFRYIFYKI